VAGTPGDSDRGRAERARDRAEARLAGGTPADSDSTRAVCALARALARLQVAGRSHG
jgi:F0F1-type ATP synthase epsilon subunit